MATRIGDFVVNFGDELGKGTFGNVYKAEHAQRKSLAAAKKINLCQRGMSSKSRSLAEREFTVLEKLQGHPNVVRYLDHIADEKSMWIFMEFCDLGNLPNFMTNQRPSMREKLKLMYECASAIAFMHSRVTPIVHRDIKPANILMKSLDDQCVVKVSDFGTSKILEGANLTEHQTMETMAGTMAFMAPEFFKHLEQESELKYHPSVDTFSLGLVFLVVFLYEENQQMFPTSAGKHKTQPSNHPVPVGKEMFLADTKGKALPELFQHDFSERKNLQQLIKRMCAYEDCDRVPISEVKAKLWQFYVECENEFQKENEELSTSQMSLQEQPLEGTVPLKVFVQNVEEMGGTVWEYIQETEIVRTFTTTIKPDLVYVRKIEEDTDGNSIIPIPLEETWRDETNKVRKCTISRTMPSDSSSKACKTILLVGATGAGKSTLIDGMMNYIQGIKWDQKVRLKLINLTEEEKQRRDAGQAISQTEWVTAYAIPTDKTSKIPYDLLVIDTPGFGDTRGIQQDQKVASQIEYLFRNTEHHGIDSIDGICFLVQAPLVRLTPTQRYIFDQILSLFGKDVSDNIFIMVTFADAKKPPVINTLKKEKIPFVKYFKFNNSALVSKNENLDSQSSENESEEESNPTLEQQYWDIGMTSFEKFFSALERVEPKSLTLTADVLKTREKLKCALAYIEEKNKQNTQKMARILQEKTALEANEVNIRENKDFEYEVDEEKMQKVPIESGRHVTNCSFCHETCHENCAFADDKDKMHCIAMCDGKCTICTNKCDWSAHYNQGYIFKLVVKRVKRTSKEIRHRFESAKEGKRSSGIFISRLEDEYKDTCIQVTRRVNQARKCLLELQQIALKPDPLSEVDYIELLIDDEKRQAKEGYLDRIEQLEMLKTRAKLLQEIQEKANN